MKILIYFSYIFIVFATTSAHAFSYTLEITQAELQERIQQKMPIKKKKYFVTVTLSEPKVALSTGSDRIDIESNIDAVLPGGVATKGRGNIEGSIEYVQDTGEFYFIKPEIKNLKVDNVSDKHQETIRKVADFAAKGALKRFPVYRFKDENLKQKLAKAILKSVHVENGKLILELGI